jgi:hypothetical protein
MTVIGSIVTVVPVRVVAVAIVGSVVAVTVVWVTAVITVVVVMIDAAEYHGCGDPRAYSAPTPSVTSFCSIGCTRDDRKSKSRRCD